MPGVQIVVPDDYPPAYGSAEQEDLQRLAGYGPVTVHTTRYADRAEFFRRIAPALALLRGFLEHYQHDPIYRQPAYLPGFRPGWQDGPPRGLLNQPDLELAAIDTKTTKQGGSGVRGRTAAQC